MDPGAARGRPRAGDKHRDHPEAEPRGAGGLEEKIEAVWRGERDDAVAMEGVDARRRWRWRHRQARQNFDRVYGKPNKERENFYP